MENKQFGRSADEFGRLTENQIQLIYRVRRELHSMPELACREENTKSAIIRFLKLNTSLEIHDMGRWLYAAHREDEGKTIAVRADFDAVPTESGCAAHRCGHDGHTAALLGLALLLEGRRLGCSVILLFQHAEEVGVGGAKCCELFEHEHIDLMYGCHNIPGEPMGTVLVKQGTFACASCGLQVEYAGKPTHAAYPENGINPTNAVAELAMALPRFGIEIGREHGNMTIATIVGMYSGERAFGVAAANGAVYATLRSEDSACLDQLIDRSVNKAKLLAGHDNLEISVEMFDKFPATVNEASLVDSMCGVLEMACIPVKRLETPFRWSEDFGHYGSRTRAVFFGIGSGLDTAPLHTQGFEYPDGLAPITAEVFFRLICGAEG